MSCPSVSFQPLFMVWLNSGGDGMKNPISFSWKEDSDSGMNCIHMASDDMTCSRNGEDGMRCILWFLHHLSICLICPCKNYGSGLTLSLDFNFELGTR